MKKAQFSRVMGLVQGLTGTQMAQLQAALAQTQSERSSLNAIEQARPVACRHCGSSHIVRNGTRNGLQRVVCRDCQRSSNATSGTPLSRLRHKEKFEHYAQCMKARMTLRDTARTVGISLDTAFRWRHRFLLNVRSHQPHDIAGLLEVDETFFRESQKGSCQMTRAPRQRGGKAKGQGQGRCHKDWAPVLVGRARGQAYTTDKVLGKVNGLEVTAALKPVVMPGETILCTDGHSAYLHLQRTLGAQTKSFIAGSSRPALDNVYHIQSANSYHERLKTWLQRRLRGVATKYLPNYLAWMRLQTWTKGGVSSDVIIASALGRQVINL